MAHEADEWQLYYTADGHPYYHNHTTGESTWAEIDEVGEASAFSTPSDDVSGSSWASDDEDRFQSYLLTAEGQQALKIEEVQAEQLLAQRRKRLGHADAPGFAFTPRSPKELAEAYSDMDELSEDDSLQVRHHYGGPHVNKSTHHRSGSEGSFYKNGSTLLAAPSPAASDSPRPLQHYADPRQQFMVSHDDQYSLHGTEYLSHQFEQPEYYDTRSPRSRSHKSSNKRRHRDHKRIRRKPLNFKFSNHFHGDDAGSDVDTGDELSEGEDEDLQEILAIDESISKVYNAFAVTGSVLTSCTAHASKWMYDNAAALVSVVYTRTVRELEKLAASQPPVRPQAALA